MGRQRRDYGAAKNARSLFCPNGSGQRLISSGKVSDIVPRSLAKHLRKLTALCCIATEQNDTAIKVVLRQCHLLQLSGYHILYRCTLRIGQASLGKLVCGAGVKEDSSLVVAEHAHKTAEFDRGRAAERAPNWNAELIAADISEAHSDQPIR